MKQTPNSRLTLIVGLTWFFLIIIGYSITHYGDLFALIIPLLSAVKSMLVVIAITALAAGIGYRLLIKKVLPGGLMRVVEVMLGFGIIALFTLLVGAIFAINATIIFIYVLAGIIIFSKNIYLWIKATIQLINRWPDALSKFEIAVGLFLISIFTIQFLQSFAPAIKYDALIYHLTLPHAYLQSGQIVDLKWLVMSGMPQTTEMLYMNAMALAGDNAALLLNWVFGVLTAFGLFSFLHRYIPRKSALVGVVSLFSGFTVVSSLSWGYVDWLGCLFGLGMFAFLDSYFSINEDRSLFLSGLFAGLAFSTKYPAGVLFLAGFITLVILLLIAKRNLLPEMLKFNAGAAIFALPWLIKNFVFTGNPVYPFFFASGAMDATRIGVYQGAPRYGDLFDLFLLPIRATIQGIDGTNGYSVSLGPLFLALAIGSLLTWSKLSPEDKQPIKTSGILSMVGIAIWAVGNQFSGFLIQTRFYFSLFSAFAILAGFGYFYLSTILQNHKNWHWAVNSLIILTLFFNFMQIGKDFVKKGTLVYLSGLQDRQAYLEMNLGWYARAIFEINTMDQDKRIVMLYEPRGLGCIPRCDPDEILDNWKVAYHNNPSTNITLANWRKSGFTHILVYSEGIRFLREYEDPHHPVVELDALDLLLQKLKLEKDYGDVYKLYQIGPD